jgi:hypothetical protein
MVEKEKVTEVPTDLMRRAKSGAAELPHMTLAEAPSINL